VTLKVFDTLGRRVYWKALGEFSGGRGEVVWDGHDDAGVSLASGVYYYYIEGTTRSQIRKLVYLK
jgi:flagellar hook assembly protein FlgD